MITTKMRLLAGTLLTIGTVRWPSGEVVGVSPK
jgi:hypothetical protein